jgi:hypothetical protein
LAQTDVATASITQVGETSWNVIFDFEDATTDAEQNNAIATIADEIEDQARAECIARATEGLGEDECNKLVVLYATQEGSVDGDDVDVLYTVVSDRDASAAGVVCSLVLLSLSLAVAFL